MSEAANEELMLTGWRDGVCRAISAGGKHTQASLARWKELGLEPRTVTRAEALAGAAPLARAHFLKALEMMDRQRASEHAIARKLGP